MYVIKNIFLKNDTYYYKRYGIHCINILREVIKTIKVLLVQ